MIKGILLKLVKCLALICIEVVPMLKHARRRRGNATDLQEILESIVKAASSKEARAILKRIAEYLEEEKNVKEVKNVKNEKDDTCH